MWAGAVLWNHEGVESKMVKYSFYDSFRNVIGLVV